MYGIPSEKSMAGVGMWAGKSNMCFMAWISIFSSMSRSPLFKFHDSALLSSIGIIIFSCSSIRTLVSIRLRTSVSAIALIVVVAAAILFFLRSRLRMFFPSLVIKSPRYLYESVSSISLLC